MPENPDSPREEGEESNDGDSSHLFVIDNAPAQSKEELGIPSYDKKFNEILQAQDKNDDTPKPTRPKPPQNTCWNCEGSHSLRDCPEPRDPGAINRNRQIFMSKQTPRFSKASRYHLDEDNKYPHIQPGKISRRLRRALGLNVFQLPRHIYKMRSLGYPPGWVEEARVCHSGLFLFDSEGQEVADPGFEDGEVVAAGAKDKFDVKKIIEYPGFNCACEPDMIDETERLGATSMRDTDSIERMKSIWQPKAVRSYKRKRMSNVDPNCTISTPSTKSDKKRSLLLLDDMDDMEGENSSEEDGEVAEIEETLSAAQTSPAHCKRAHSPSTEDSNKKKQKVEGTSETGGEKCLPDVSDNKEKTDAVSPAGPSKDCLSIGHVKSVALGTPVIVTSEFKNLPAADKFAKDICDVINFENLPDSTGKYEKMFGLIKKVRTFVSKNNEDDEN